MGDSQQFCLKWNNHHSNLLSVFDDLYKQQSFCDVTLACDGTVIRAHKNVLSACSPFFHAVFMANPCKHPVVILKDIRFTDLKALVEFMYRGEVNVSQEELPVLLKVAEALKIRGLAGSENGSDEPSRRRKRKRRRKSASDADSGSGSDTEPELVRTPITKPPTDQSVLAPSSAPAFHPSSSQSSSAAVPSSSHHDVHSHPKDDVHTPASTPPVIRTANAGRIPVAAASETIVDEVAEFEPTDILEATMATQMQSTPAHDTRQASAAAAVSQIENSITEALVIPDDDLDIKPIINFEPVASTASASGALVPSTSGAVGAVPSHSGASNSSSSMMDSNMDSSDMTSFAEAGLPSTSAGGASGSAPHGMYCCRGNNDQCLLSTFYPIWGGVLRGSGALVIVR